MDQCEMCMYYGYDEEYEEYFCTVDMDEDDMARLMSGNRNTSCPYFRDGDEYKVVRRQM